MYKLNKNIIKTCFLFKVMAPKTKELITKDMTIGEAVSKHPETIPVFLRNGLHCVGCGIAQFENIEEGALAHGIKVDKLVKELNEAVSKKK